MNSITYVGLDVHKATVSVAVAEGRRGGEVRHVGAFPNRPDHIAKLVERLGKGGRTLSFCYEAGPCGYGLHRGRPLAHTDEGRGSREDRSARRRDACEAAPCRGVDERLGA